MKRTLVLTLIMSILLAGCGPSWKANPRAQWTVTNTTFTGVVETLTIAKPNFSDSDFENIQKAAILGRDALIEWRKAIVAGEDVTDPMLMAQKALIILMNYYTPKGD